MRVCFGPATTGRNWTFPATPSPGTGFTGRDPIWVWWSSRARPATTSSRTGRSAPKAGSTTRAGRPTRSATTGSRTRTAATRPWVTPGRRMERSASASTSHLTDLPGTSIRETRSWWGRVTRTPCWVGTLRERSTWPISGRDGRTTGRPSPPTTPFHPTFEPPACPPIRSASWRLPRETAGCGPSVSRPATTSFTGLPSNRP